jgi:hypothetical protein
VPLSFVALANSIWRVLLTVQSSIGQIH